MRQVSSTSVDVRHGVISRKAESDTDSAISMSMNLAELERQPIPSPRLLSPIPAEWESRSKMSKVTTSIKRSFLFVLPSPIGLMLDRHMTIAKKQPGNSALDGLRGLACLLVFNQHFTHNFDSSFMMGYGINHKATIVQWPFVRFLWSGFTMVAIFFVVSGYALSHKALRQIHNGNTADAHRTITSSVLRRAFRLFAPTFIAILFCGILSWYGIFDKSRTNYKFNNNYYGLNEKSPPRFDSLLDQLRDVTGVCYRMLNVWWAPDGSLHAGDYDPHTWTMAIEFRNSMLVLLSLLSISRLRTAPRLLTQLSLITFSVSTQNRNLIPFQAGMLLADLDHLRKSRTRFLCFATGHVQQSRVTSITLRLASANSWLYPLMFILGVFMCSAPVHAPEYDTIYRHVLFKVIPTSFQQPAEWFRLPGAIMIVWSAANSNILRPIFCNSFSQYMGSISFAVFLVHGAVIRAVLYAAMPMIYNLTGDGTRDGQTTGRMVGAWFVGLVMVLPITLWIADLFWRTVDEPCVWFSKWLEAQLSERDDSEGCGSPKRWS